MNGHCKMCNQSPVACVTMADNTRICFDCITRWALQIRKEPRRTKCVVCETWVDYDRVLDTTEASIVGTGVAPMFSEAQFVGTMTVMDNGTKWPTCISCVTAKVVETLSRSVRPIKEWEEPRQPYPGRHDMCIRCSTYDCEPEHFTKKCDRCKRMLCDHVEHDCELANS